MRAITDTTVRDPGPYQGAKNAPAFDPNYGILKSTADPEAFLTPPGTDTTLGKAGPRRARAIVIRSRRLRADHRGRVRVLLKCPAQKGRDCSGRIRLRLRTRDGKIFRAGHASLTLRSGHARRVRVHVSRRGRRALRRRHRLPGRVAVLNRDDAGGVKSLRGVRVRRGGLRR